MNNKLIIINNIIIDNNLIKIKFTVCRRKKDNLLTGSHLISEESIPSPFLQDYNKFFEFLESSLKGKIIGYTHIILEAYNKIKIRFNKRQLIAATNEIKICIDKLIIADEKKQPIEESIEDILFKLGKNIKLIDDFYQRTKILIMETKK